MKKTSTRLTALALVLALLLTSCAGGASATTMHLRKTEGTVGVADGKGKDVEPRENLGLYSGYGVDTNSESYAWIDLDEVKLTKLDQNSEIAIAKQGKALEIEVKSGALFFNVTEPLADDESMNIRTSTMVIGIRGTCGWVHMESDNLMYVYLLRGKVECSVLGENGSALATEMLTPGQVAKMSLDGDTASIVIEDFSQQDIPAFVMPEIEEDEEILDSIQPDPAEAPDDSQEDDADVPGDQSEEDAGQTDEDTDPADEDAGAADEDPAPADNDTGAADEDPGAAGEDPAPADEDAEQTSQPSNEDILAQYKAIVAQGKSYDYTSGLHGFEQTLETYRYSLYQESGFSVPTLILEAQSIDYNFYLLYRYDPATGTTSLVDRDRASRFESNHNKFLTEISINNDWHDLTDTGYLESQLS